MIKVFTIDGNQSLLTHVIKAIQLCKDSDLIIRFEYRDQTIEVNKDSDRRDYLGLHNQFILKDGKNEKI